MAFIVQAREAQVAQEMSVLRSVLQTVFSQGRIPEKIVQKYP
jgi:hypothetical protein